MNCDRLEFYKNPDMTISETQLAAFRNLIAHRLQWEPVAYITGRKEFWSFSLEVNNSVLIPRPDTEVLVEETLEVAKKYESPLMNSRKATQVASYKKWHPIWIPAFAGMTKSRGRAHHR